LEVGQAYGSEVMMLFFTISVPLSLSPFAAVFAVNVNGLPLVESSIQFLSESGNERDFTSGASGIEHSQISPADASQICVLTRSLTPGIARQPTFEGF
jgi:hypothetical protein